MPQFEKRQAIQMAKDLVALGLSGLRSHTSAPIYAPEDVSRTSQDVVNSLCQCLECNGTLDADCLQDAIEWYVLATIVGYQRGARELCSKQWGAGLQSCTVTSMGSSGKSMR